MEEWFVVFTKPKQEKLAAEHLQRQGYYCFLPFAKNPNKIRVRRVITVIEPLFPRYLFIKVDVQRQSIAPVRSTQGVSSIVMFGNRLANIPEHIIECIQNQISPETGCVELTPQALNAGDKVKILDGPLAGLEAVFKQSNAQNRALILMSLLGVRTTVQVRKDLLEPVI